VYLGLYYFAGRKANFRETLALAPPGTTIAPTQSAKLANARTRSNRLRPGYVANNVEFHANIVSDHADPVNAIKAPNDEAERRGVASATIEADLSSSSPPSLAHRR
jgi:hypothetical protein